MREQLQPTAAEVVQIGELLGLWRDAVSRTHGKEDHYIEHIEVSEELRQRAFGELEARLGGTVRHAETADTELPEVTAARGRQPYAHKSIDEIKALGALLTGQPPEATTTVFPYELSWQAGAGVVTAIDSAPVLVLPDAMDKLRLLTASEQLELFGLSVSAAMTHLGAMEAVLAVGAITELRRLGQDSLGDHRLARGYVQRWSRQVQQALYHHEGYMYEDKLAQLMQDVLRTVATGGLATEQLHQQTHLAAIMRVYHDMGEYAQRVQQCLATYQPSLRAAADAEHLEANRPWVERLERDYASYCALRSRWGVPDRAALQKIFRKQDVREPVGELRQRLQRQHADLAKDTPALAWMTYFVRNLRRMVRDNGLSGRQADVRPLQNLLGDAHEQEYTYQWLVGRLGRAGAHIDAAREFHGEPTIANIHKLVCDHWWDVRSAIAKKGSSRHTIHDDLDAIENIVFMQAPQSTQEPVEDHPALRTARNQVEVVRKQALRAEATYLFDIATKTGPILLPDVLAVNGWSRLVAQNSSERTPKFPPFSLSADRLIMVRLLHEVLGASLYAEEEVLRIGAGKLPYIVCEFQYDDTTYAVAECPVDDRSYAMFFHAARPGEEDWYTSFGRRRLDARRHPQVTFALHTTTNLIDYAAKVAHKLHERGLPSSATDAMLGRLHDSVRAGLYDALYATPDGKRLGEHLPGS